MDIVERITKFLDERAKVRGLDQEQIAGLHAGDEREALMLPVFDGNAVYSALRDDAKKRTSPENVSDALDALAKLMREATRYRGDK